MARLLPPRAARADALNLLGVTEGEALPATIEDDDVAQHADEDSVHSDDDVASIASDGTLDDSLLFPVEDATDGDESDEDDVLDAGLTAPDGGVWTTNPDNAVGRQPLRNIFRDAAGFHAAMHPQSRMEAFQAITSDIIDEVVRFTNKAGRILARQQNIQWKICTHAEMWAFLGIHFLAGVFKAHHRDERELFSLRDGINLLRATMSYKRFFQLKCALRFDDPARRDRNDKLAPVRHVTHLFNETLSRIYKPGAFLTVDEMLIEFHGRVAFRQYIPTKPGKFGIKVFWAVDAENCMPLKCLVYIGAETLPAHTRAASATFGEAVVMHLMSGYLDKGRNVTTDNYFTSVPLANRLAARNTTIVGTIRSNRRELPPSCKDTGNRQRGDSRHYYSAGNTVCSFWDKGTKPVLLLSSSHGVQQNTQSPAKPAIVENYNSTKAGVDNLDKLVRGYSSKRKCRRWPYGVFFTLMDVSVIAAYKMYQRDNDDSHYIFKRELAYEMCLPFVHQRSLLPRLNDCIKQAMANVGITAAPVQPAVQQASGRQKQGRCKLCPRERDRKSRTKCSVCESYVCLEHSQLKCSNCS